MQKLTVELARRWEDMFAALAGGDDLPPARRLRTEGLMEAAVLLEIATPDALTQMMNECYRTAFGRGIEHDFGDDWQDFFPFPQIPAMAARAPVFPSTRD